MGDALLGLANKWGERYGQPPHRLMELEPWQVAFDMAAMELGEYRDREFLLANKAAAQVAVIVRRS